MQMKSIARRPFKYAGALVQPQSEFSVKSERDVKVLTAARRAALLAAPQPLAPAAPAQATKRSYKRRDMTAETAAAPAPALALPIEPMPAVPVFESFFAAEPPPVSDDVSER